MSSQPELKVTERDSTLNPRQLRAAGFLPATVYGKDTPAQNIQVKTYDFVRALAKGTREFKLTGPGFDLTVKVQQLQSDQVTQEPLNVEFLELGASTGKGKKAATEKQPAASKSSQAKAEEPSADNAEAVAV